MVGKSHGFEKCRRKYLFKHKAFTELLLKQDSVPSHHCINIFERLKRAVIKIILCPGQGRYCL
jgi:hypothetical protein